MVNLPSRENQSEIYDRARLHQLYRNLLLDDIVPFWTTHGIDWEYGGILSCMADDGSILSGDKYIWSQARSVWTFSALYNRVEKRPEFLRIAENSIRFLLAHGRDEHGSWVYRTTRDGTIVEGPISIYSDCFVVYGFSEYYRAVADSSLLSIALSTFERVCRRVEAPDFSETAPYTLFPGRKIHAVPMTLTEVSNELFQTTGFTGLETLLDRFVGEVMNHFLRPDRKLLLEFLSDTWHELPPNEGTAVMPGHAIESMWFVLHVARRRGDRELVARASEAIRWHLEAGWDPEYGGIFLGIDAEGREPSVRNWEKKAWWPHTEALYALLLSYQLTGEQWCLEWYEEVHKWAFAHYPVPSGEWRQRLTREGHPTDEVIGLPVKDPFHLPRAAILITQLLAESQAT
jgi:N-acylglucosamine 2-epimerase